MNPTSERWSDLLQDMVTDADYCEHCMQASGEIHYKLGDVTICEICVDEHWEEFDEACDRVYPQVEWEEEQMIQIDLDWAEIDRAYDEKVN